MKRAYARGFACAVACAVLLALTAACAPRMTPPGADVRAPEISEDAFIMADGARLPLRRWPPKGEHADERADEHAAEPWAVLLALHGFNDYSYFFDDAGAWLAARGVAVYAYDQRGFGRAPGRGVWAGRDAYINDLTAALSLLRRAHPGRPLYALGESMGASFIMAARARGVLRADGIILSAPAVWGRETMPWWQQFGLWLGAHTVPWARVTGRGIKRSPSDNIKMLRALGRDPLVIKETRVDALYGLTNAMDEALAAAAAPAAGADMPALYLYGVNDDIVPPEAALRAARAFMNAGGDETKTFAAYDTGYHLLLRDLNAEIVWKDIAAWMKNPGADKPPLSAAARRGREILAGEGADRDAGPPARH
ncbi:MAG: alpha/beta fold hydrolase [Rhodospirillales bacterium]